MQEKLENLFCWSGSSPFYHYGPFAAKKSKNIFYLFLHVPKSPITFSNLNYNCSNLSNMRNLQEQVKKAFCYQKLFWPFTIWINCSSDLKIFANFKSFSRSPEHFFLTVAGQNNFGNKIPFLLPHSSKNIRNNPSLEEFLDFELMKCEGNFWYFIDDTF